MNKLQGKFALITALLISYVSVLIPLRKIQKENVKDVIREE
ncbi:hypothetical protein ACWFRC_08915 [Bacillus cereus]